MNLKKLIFTNNDCYKAGRTISVKGIMVHSTGANNPTLKRYVGPNDGLLGQNVYGNHWNQPSVALGRQVCVHGFIGKLADGSIATYQTLPWNHRGWHGGSGSKGCVNDTHIGFEICEDGLTDASYFNAVYKEAAELCAYLCKEYNLNPAADGVIIGHYEGNARGIASNHGDPKNWFPKFGKSMDTFRAYVKELMGAGTTTPTTPPTTTTPTPTKSNEEIAKEVIAGKWGNGDDRKQKLTAAGYDYSTIQSIVNKILNGTATPSTPALTPTPAPAKIEKGSKVKIKAGAKYYSGANIPSWVMSDTWIVLQVSGDRAVIDKNVSGKNSIMSPIKVSDLTVV